MAFNPLFIIPDFFLYFPKELSYGYLKFEGKSKKKSGIMKSGLDAMPLFLLDDLLNYKAFNYGRNILPLRHL